MERYQPLALNWLKILTVNRKGNNPIETPLW